MDITFKGKPMTLRGVQLKAGDAMPDFTVHDVGLEAVRGANLTGLRVFLAVPSLDTGVCDMQVRRFNEKAAEFQGVSIYALSMDLPFAQARWCGASGVKAVKTLSDYKDHSFAKATGTYIEELGLLTRSVFIVDRAGIVVYAQYVPEVSDHPDYEAVYAKLTQITT